MREERTETERWNRVKERIMVLWDEISDEELEGTRGNISSISNLILQKYDVSKQEIAGKLVDALHDSAGDDPGAIGTRLQ